jgi:hypothetical protein
MEKIYGTRGKGLRLILYKRDVKKYPDIRRTSPIIIKMESTSNKESYIMSLTLKQCIDLINKTNDFIVTLLPKK